MNIAAAFKAEVLRVSKKVIRAEVDGLRLQLAHQRKQIAQLKKEIAEQRKLIRDVGRSKREALKPTSASKRRPQGFSLV